MLSILTSTKSVAKSVLKSYHENSETITSIFYIAIILNFVALLLLMPLLLFLMENGLMEYFLIGVLLYGIKIAVNTVKFILKENGHLKQKKT